MKEKGMGMKEIRQMFKKRALQRKLQRKDRLEEFKDRLANSDEKSKREILSHITNSIVEDIQVLSDCADKNMYEYTDEYIDGIFNIISLELRIAKSKFFPTKNKSKIRGIALDFDNETKK